MNACAWAAASRAGAAGDGSSAAASSTGAGRKQGAGRGSAEAHVISVRAPRYAARIAGDGLGAAAAGQDLCTTRYITYRAQQQQRLAQGGMQQQQMAATWSCTAANLEPNLDAGAGAVLCCCCCWLLGPPLSTRMRAAGRSRSPRVAAADRPTRTSPPMRPNPAHNMRSGNGARPVPGCLAPAAAAAWGALGAGGGGGGGAAGGGGRGGVLEAAACAACGSAPMASASMSTGVWGSRQDMSGYDLLWALVRGCNQGPAPAGAAYGPVVGPLATAAWGQAGTELSQELQSVGLGC
jgi:hypothetical protein